MSSSPTPEGLGSVSGAPNLPEGFADTFTSRYVDTGELRQHAVIGGDGAPLPLVHGWPRNRYAWRLVMPALARHFPPLLATASHPVVVPYLRGYGTTGFRSGETFRNGQQSFAEAIVEVDSY